MPPSLSGRIIRCHPGNGDTAWEEGRSSCEAASADGTGPSPGVQGCPRGTPRVQRLHSLPGAEGDDRFVDARQASSSEDQHCCAALSCSDRAGSAEAWRDGRMLPTACLLPLGCPHRRPITLLTLRVCPGPQCRCCVSLAAAPAHGLRYSRCSAVE